MLLTIGVLLQSCAHYKNISLAKRGKVKNKEYLVQLPLNIHKNLPFVEVTINEKKYNFLFDTGAEMSVIGMHIKDEVDYKTSNNSKAKGASGVKRSVEFVEVAEISFGEIKFERTGAVIADLSHLEQILGCNKIDGLIGNNLMRKAIWQLDYQRGTIALSDDRSNFVIAPSASQIVMNAGKWRNVRLDVVVDGVESEFLFDTGFGGKIKSNQEFFDRLAESKTEMKYIVETGHTGADFHGFTQGTEYSVLIENINIEGVLLNDQIMILENNASSLIGSEIFKNYILTIDWNNDILFLDRVVDIEPDELTSFDLVFYPNFSTNMIEVFRLREDHTLNEKVSIGAQILMINSVDVANFSTEELCEYWEAENQELRNAKVLDIVLLDGGQRKEIQLTKK